MRIIKLVHKAQNGDADAFLALFEKYQAELYRIAFVYTKNRDDALDVVQETAYISFKKLHTLKEPKFFKAWLTKITISCAIDLLRKKRKVIHIHSDYLENTPSAAEDIPLSLTLRDLLDSLNENEKSCILLKYYSGYNFREISEITDLPLGTVKSVLYRALKKLRKKAGRADMYGQPY